MTTDPIDDHERELWVMNDAFWYMQYMHSHQSIDVFIKENWVEIDEYIRKELG